MESLQAFFAQTGNNDIHHLAQYIQRHVNEQWETIFHQCRAEMIERYPEIGDSVYGIYGTNLFRQIHNQLREVSLRAVPRLPGNFMMSREWGEEDDRQRWMWSKITRKDDTAVGTIVTAFYHDHIEIRIPRAFRILALEETKKADVIRALSGISPDFKNAQEAKIEIAQYLAQLEQAK